MAVLGPGSDRPAAVRPAAQRRTAADGFFASARNAATSRQGKKAGVAVAGRRSRRSRPSGLIRPFEVAWDAPIKQTDGDHHDCHHRCGTRTWHHGSQQRRTSAHQRRRTARALRTMAHDFASRRAGRAPRPKPAEASLRPSMSQMADRVPPICASLVKGDGDNSFTLIWSRRNSD